MAVILYMCLFVASCLTPAIIGGGHLIGGFSPADHSRHDVQEASDFAVEEYNKVSNDAYFYRALRIVSVQTQVVAGINYKLVMDIGKTPCRKNHVVYGDNGGVCDVANSEVSQVFNCTFIVYKTLPLPTSEFKLTKHNCILKNATQDTGSEE